MLLPYLVDWDSDLILKHASAELLVADEGFLIPSGVLHAPGTALTLELQEDSDVLAMFQALNAGRIISKELLFKDVRPEDRGSTASDFRSGSSTGSVNGDPYFYENRHLMPLPRRSGRIWSPLSRRRPGSSTTQRSTAGRGWWCRRELQRMGEPGVYSVFVWGG